MAGTNFLIGRGELLTYAIKGPRRPMKKAEAYTLSEAQDRLIPQLVNVNASLDTLPTEACPGGLGVVRVAVNPSFIAKSYFPTNLFRSQGLEAIGSRTVRLTPEKWTKTGDPTETTTTEIFVAGHRASFAQLPEWAASISPESPEARDFVRIEWIAPIQPEDRIRGNGSDEERFFEVGLHLLSDERTNLIQRGFDAYAEECSVRLYPKLSFQAGSLWFVPAEGDRNSIDLLAQFAFVRVIRPVPKFRGMRPVSRGGAVAISCGLPTERPLSDHPRVAILDGGLPPTHVVGPWVHSYKVLDPKAQDDPDGLEHGLAVTSAFLFGPLTPNAVGPRPYSYVDHLRVLDNDTHTEDPLALYRTLGFIEQVLLSRQYEFINLELTRFRGEVACWDVTRPEPAVFRT